MSRDGQDSEVLICEMWEHAVYLVCLSFPHAAAGCCLHGTSSKWQNWTTPIPQEGHISVTGFLLWPAMQAIQMFCRHSLPLTSFKLGGITRDGKWILFWNRDGYMLVWKALNFVGSFCIYLFSMVHGQMVNRYLKAKAKTQLDLWHLFISMVWIHSSGLISSYWHHLQRLAKFMRIQKSALWPELWRIWAFIPLAS